MKRHPPLCSRSRRAKHCIASCVGISSATNRLKAGSNMDRVRRCTSNFLFLLSISSSNSGYVSGLNWKWRVPCKLWKRSSSMKRSFTSVLSLLNPVVFSSTWSFVMRATIEEMAAALIFNLDWPSSSIALRMRLRLWSLTFLFSSATSSLYQLEEFPLITE